ncbi:MAG: metallophosphoesterase family protein [Anaerolineae bacterium]
MQIGLIADTHNDRRQIERALARLRLENVTTILHAGDVTSSRMLRLFKGFDVWVSRGNMDRDPGLLHVAHELFGPDRYRNTLSISLNGAALALVHDGRSDTATELIASGDYGYVVHGHSHRPRDEVVGSTRVINPGALGNSRWHTPTFAILNLATGDLSWIKL